ncbi:PP2C family protein-serine/threonine phosphatase [Nocardioides sp. CER19]|uniref:PP2C family protein-serine/threonine phosphatase n=1 Tax=Nocardioides sp. CER19 TaxID=3038538 RepID=UPI00244BA077|nr:PP2C family protein-serine/threonine phosphatase [Nocardioides sp. CER19]MDH2412685.1 PP2C family protein-serine/threonine phosphatase [Nocardioides sp. CER19]
MPDRPRRLTHDPKRLAAITAGVGVVLTAAASWSTARVDANSEHRLLVQQTKQAAAVLSTAILVLEEPLSTALSIQAAAGRAGDRAAFTRFMSTYVGTGKPFVSASLWTRQGDRVSQLATTGATPALTTTSPAGRSYALHAFEVKSPSVRQVTAGGQPRIAWALADPGSGLAVYAESALPADRHAPVARDSAYANLDYAIYLGPRATDAALSTTDVDPSSLPLRGDTARESIPLGDTTLILVATPNEHLGSTQSRWLPLGLLLGGLLLTAIAAIAARRLLRDRSDAEADAATITALFEQVETLYAQQRDLFERLQRALLPHGLPAIPALESASQYVAGAQGTEIGGDWYSLVALDEHRFGFVVGDVSGRGVDTVAVMAQARFTVRAYLLDGQSPATALEKCSHQFDISTDGHLTTVITGVGDVRTGEVTMANAGHLPPFLLDGEIRPVDVPPGRPLGTGPAHYDETTIAMPPGSTLFCFTDGLVERRGESIDVGLDRLAATLSRAGERSVAELVTHAVDTLRNPDAPDDIAALALRWEGPR